MAFTSLVFLAIFFPVFFAAYYVLPGRYKNFWALFGSGLFYVWGAPRFFPVIIATSILDYFLSHSIARNAQVRQRKLLLGLGITVNVGILFYFKYANFFVDELNETFRETTFGIIPWTHVALPIGISFITFEKISYLVDVFVKRTRPAESLTNYFLFLALFPHLIAGPIFRYHDIAPQLSARELTFSDIQLGMERFTLGLAKKVLIADAMAEVANHVFGLRSTDLTVGYAWLGALTYSMQIYFDFSGYSDMAIGLGRMMGFRFLENFDRPYTSKSITEFWRRWHISLSNWMREYLYIPLGGNRGSTVRTYVNLWIVFLISGFWHGANWTFLIWGCYHGLLLITERLFLLSMLKRLPGLLANSFTFLLVLIGWVFFRAETFGEGTAFVTRMFAPLYLRETISGPLLSDLLSYRQLTILIFALLFSFLPQEKLWRRLLEKREFMNNSLVMAFLRGPLTYIALYVVGLRLVNSHFHPFIYFRF